LGDPSYRKSKTEKKTNAILRRRNACVLEERSKQAEKQRTTTDARNINSLNAVINRLKALK